MNCASLARALDLVDLEARFDRDGAARHLALCAACAARYPEIGPLLATAPRAARSTRIESSWGWAAAFLVGATLLLARAPLGIEPPREAAVASATPRAIGPPIQRPSVAPGVRYLPSSASTVVYTSRRPVGDRDCRGIESTVIRGGDRAAGTIELLR